MRKHDGDLDTVKWRAEPWRKWAVLVAMFMTAVIVAMTSYSSGVLYVALLDKFGEGKAKTSLIVSTPMVFLNLGAPVSSLVVNKFSCRVAIVTGGICLTLSGFLSSFATNINVLLFTHGVLGGIGYSLTYPIIVIMLSFYFEKHRNLVISTSVAMVSFGMVSSAPLTLKLLDTFALRGTFLIFGAISAHLCITGVLCMPSQLEIKVQKTRMSKESEYSISKSGENCCSSRWCGLLSICKTSCDYSVLKEVPYLLFQLSNLTWVLMFILCVVHFPNYAVVNGATEDQVTLLMSCFSISNGCGRFLAALTVISNKMKDKILFVHMSSIGLLGVSSVTFPLYSQFEVSKFVFAIIAGICTGMPNAVSGPITISLVGVERFSNAQGFGFFCCGLGSLIGPVIAGLLYGQSGSYKYSFIFGGCVCLVGCCLSLTILIHQRRKTKGGHHKHEIQKVVERTVAVNGEAVELITEH